MANSPGPTTDSVIAGLREKPFEYDFFAAVRRLQCSCPELPRVGHSWSPAQDVVRFAQSPALDFAPATLEGVQQKATQGRAVLYSRHFGLLGPNGPMPLCYTEYARERILHHGDPTFAAFCNVFHHRMLSFFFRAWADARKAVDLDRPGGQHWAEFAASLIGLGMESLRNRDQVPDRAKLFFAGRLAQQTRNAEGLEAIVQSFFGVPTELRTFVRRWLKLPAESVCRLGRSADTGTLGMSVIVGSRFFSCQLHFRLRLGPLSLADYMRLLPTRDPKSSFRRLRDWVLQYAGEHYSWDVQLVLAKDEVPRTKLGTAGRLGWTTWLKTLPFTHDADDLIFEPAAA